MQTKHSEALMMGAEELAKAQASEVRDRIQKALASRTREPIVNKPLKLPGVGQYIRLEVDQEVMEVTVSYRSISVPILHLNIFMELNIFSPFSHIVSYFVYVSAPSTSTLEESW